MPWHRTHYDGSIRLVDHQRIIGSLAACFNANNSRSRNASPLFVAKFTGYRDRTGTVNSKSRGISRSITAISAVAQNFQHLILLRAFG